ncbi:MAG: hypothetical protein Kow0010_11230 [Dehalococcoidia bacterium]
MRPPKLQPSVSVPIIVFAMNAKARHPLRSRTWLAIDTILVVTLLAGVAFWWWTIFAKPSGDAADRAPRFDVPQSAVAEDQSIRFELRSAAFGGTATHVEMRAIVLNDDPANPVVQVRLGPERFERPGLIPLRADRGFVASPGRYAAVRLGPVGSESNPPDEAHIATSSVEVLRLDGTIDFVFGRWELPLQLPGNIAERLRIEVLEPTDIEYGEGYDRVQIIGFRGTTETVVSILPISTARIRPLGGDVQLHTTPFDKNGHRLYADVLLGGLVSFFMTEALFAFPPTPFGEAVRILLPPFGPEPDVVEATWEVNFAGIIEREGLRGAAGEVAEILPEDIIARSGTSLPIAANVDLTQAEFLPAFTGARPVRFTMVNIEFSDDALARLAGYVLVDGERLPGSISGADSGVTEPLDPSKVITPSRATLTVYIDSIDDLRGVVTVVYQYVDGELVYPVQSAELVPVGSSP